MMDTLYMFSILSPVRSPKGHKLEEDCYNEEDGPFSYIINICIFNWPCTFTFLIGRKHLLS